jgi:ribosomal protein L10
MTGAKFRRELDKAEPLQPSYQAALTAETRTLVRLQNKRAKLRRELKAAEAAIRVTKKTLRRLIAEGAPSLTASGMVPPLRVFGEK